MSSEFGESMLAVWKTCLQQSQPEYILVHPRQEQMLRRVLWPPWSFRKLSGGRKARKQERSRIARRRR